MVQQLDPQTFDIVYPESDGLPLADNTKQFRLIVTLHGGITTLFGNTPDVFVAGDLFWYPVEGEPWTKQAPDVMVVFGRPKGDRRSYEQWEEGNIPPQVVFEISSKSNTITELENAKRSFYQRHGVEEYYIHDPDRGTFKGWLRFQGQLQPIERIQNWVSPRLGIRFQLVDKELQVYQPNGERFLTYEELEVAKTQLQESNVELQESNVELQESNAELQDALDQEKQRVQKLLETLKEQGIDPKDLGLS